jgi:signal transduction histidine kinase
MLARGEPLEIDGEGIGTVLTVINPPDFSPAEQAFLRRTNSALWIASLGAALAALLVGLLLARTLTGPLRRLTSAAERIAGGELEQRVNVKSGDEIGQLAEAFNQMSRAITHANRQRRQMTADIAHDLRTPLTVIAGYIESMRTGVLKPSQERLDTVYSEIERLENLVDDLGVLARADSGELSLNLAPTSPLDLLKNAANTFQHSARQKAIQLQVEAEFNLPPVNIDESRMAQVLSNLISNALRYTPEGGRITLGAEQEGGKVAITVADNGPGIRQDDLPFIFNRFYRADESRSEENGESGLGLAICKALVEAQGGEITVNSMLGEGTCFIMRFPPAG